MNEEKIQSTKEDLYELSKSIVNAEIERVIFRNGANAINQLQQENKQLKEEIKKLKQLNQIVYVDKSEKILDELEKWLEEVIGKFEEYGASFGLTIDEEISEYITDRISGYKNTLKKLKELKGE